MTKCVNKSSKEFKDACSRLNVSADSLEIVVHEYQNTEGNGDSFPSDSYIMDRLKGTPTTTKSKAVMELWEKKYSKPQSFSSIEEANQFKKEASRFFDDNSIIIYKSNNNKYIVSINRPYSYYNLIQEQDTKKVILRTLAQEGLIQKHDAGDNYFLVLGIPRDFGGPNAVQERQKLIEEAFKRVESRVEKLGFPKDIISKRLTKTGSTAFLDINSKNLDEIKDAVSAGAKLEDIKAIYELVGFFEDKFNINFGGIISKTKAKSLTDGLIPNAFIKNNTVYLVAGNITTDIIAEEFLHPLVNTLFLENPELFDSLFKEASQLFPELKAQILSSYRGRKKHTFSAEDLKQELVAQALSRHFREEWEKSINEGSYTTEEVLEEIKKAENFFTKVWNAITNILNSILEITYGNRVRLDPKKLPSISLKQLAQIITAEDSSFWLKQDTAEIRFNLSERSDLEKFKEQNDALRIEFETLEKFKVSDSAISGIAQDFVTTISDLLTEYQNNSARIFEDFPELKVTINDKGEPTIVELGAIEEDLKNRSRESLLRFIGVDRMVNKAYNQLFRRRDIPMSVMMLGRNTKALLITAYSKFLELENFAIIGESGFEIHTSDNTDIEDLNKTTELEEVEEQFGDSQEHWQVEVRTLDVLDNATSLVKRALNSCREVLRMEEYTDADGIIRKRPIYKKSKAGVSRRVKAKDAVSSILRWTRGCLTLSDMISRLEENSESSPWILPIIERLKDTSGKESDFQSQFYKTFEKHFHSYCVVVKESGKYVTKIVNENPALKEAKDLITSTYNIGAHPLFESTGKVNTKSLNALVEINEKLKEPNAPVEELLTTAVNILGLPITSENIEKSLKAEGTEKIIRENLSKIVANLQKGSKLEVYNPFGFRATNSIEGYLTTLLKPIVEQFEDVAISSLYDNGKMYQSYITPSYMTKLVQKFRNTDTTSFMNFLSEEYIPYKWFYDSRTKTFRNDWLQRLYTTDRSQLMRHKTQLHFDKNYYMKGMTEQQYIMSVITEYFNGPNENTAWYRMPMQSNKPASEFISFHKYTNDNTALSLMSYKEVITDKLYNVFLQELERIIDVRHSNLSEDDPNYIKNYHSERGRNFVFLDFLNPYLNGESSVAEKPLTKLLKKKLDGGITVEDSVELVTIVKQAINYFIEQKNAETIESWKSQGIIDKIGSDILKEKNTEIVQEKIEEFLWNDLFATINILQLTVTDPAYYKDTEDLQKRLAQLHSPGVRGNAQARDYEGNSVTDGKLRTLYLKDINLTGEGLKSNILENLREVLQSRVDAAKTEEEKRSLEIYRDSILELYEREINIADAQSFTSPTAYRKKAFIFGTWSKEKEVIYQKIKEGKASFSEIKEAMQPLKPFTYTQINKTINGQTIKVPVQHKTAEYLLVMADAVIGEGTKDKPNLLRAIFNFMEKTAEDHPMEGIDTILFESSVKSGLHGTIDVSKFNDDPQGEVALLNVLNNAVYKPNSTEYNESYVDAVPVEDYSLQQEVPLHYYEHSQVHGSQIRALLPSDLPNDAVINGKTVKEFRREYEETIAANIQESIQHLIGEFGLDENTSLEDRKLLLARVLQKEVLSNSRYGIDLFKALLINEDGDFTIPLQDPIHSKRIEQLVNSIIKKRINKQTIPGGPVVQVSNFGMSKRLNIRFKDANGRLLKTRDEFNNDEEYRKYIKGNQKGIAYFECIAPASMREIFEYFMDEKGNIDVEAVEANNPELLKAIGYRIPTEGKHSMQPLKIVGFAPKEAGEVIIMPYEITLISGSDKPRHCFYQYNIKNLLNCWEILT